MRGIILAFALLSSASVVVDARISVGRIFSDGMVMQDHATYDQRPFVYGAAAPYEVVTVVRTTPEGSNDTFVVTANAGGDWIVQIDPDYFRASQNNLTFSIYGSASAAPIVIKNAAYGDVFICSGQSNMNENVAAAFGAAEAMSGIYPYMRFFAVAEAGATTPQSDVPDDLNATCTFPQFPVADSMQKCNTWQFADEPTVIGSFSATCFYTALALSQNLTGGRVLGMIHASVSGTPMNQWAPPEALAKCDAVAPFSSSNAAIVSDVHRPLLLSNVGNFPTDNSSLFNAMINPLVGFAIRGVIWDQGENDHRESQPYFSCIFQSLIETWRRRWRIGDFAWVFAQLGTLDAASWPQYDINAIRAAQSSALPGKGTTDTTGMAVTYDIGDMGSPYPPAHVHSRRKAEVGRRLAIAMMHAQYAIQFPSSPLLINLSSSFMWSAPTPTAIAPAAGGAFALKFATLDSKGFYLKETADAWETCVSTKDLFQVAETAGASVTAWINATVSNTDADTMLITPTVPGAYACVRYAANLWPQCAIYAVTNQLPVPPFTLCAGAAAVPAFAFPASASAPLAAVHLSPVVTKRVPGAWANGWLGHAIPPATNGPAATPPMGYNR